MGVQETVDKKVNSDDWVICPLTQTSDKMIQILSQVTKQKSTRVLDLWLDDGRDRLETQTGLVINQTKHVTTGVTVT